MKRYVELCVRLFQNIRVESSRVESTKRDNNIKHTCSLHTNSIPYKIMQPHMVQHKQRKKREDNKQITSTSTSNNNNNNYNYNNNYMMILQMRIRIREWIEVLLNPTLIRLLYFSLVIPIFWPITIPILLFWDKFVILSNRIQVWWHTPIMKKVWDPTQNKTIIPLIFFGLLLPLTFPFLIIHLMIFDRI